MDLLRLADRNWPALNRLFGLHEKIYSATGGRLGHHLPGLPPMLLLDHVGAKSGARRTTPLVYVADDENVVIVASKGGYERNPGWLHNLRAHPDTAVRIGTERRAVHAREADPEERARLWPEAVRVWPGYEGYQRRTNREIPLVILEPRGR